MFYNDRFTEEEAGSPEKSEKYYPLKELYAFDNACREAFGFQVRPAMNHSFVHAMNQSQDKENRVFANHPAQLHSLHLGLHQLLLFKLPGVPVDT